MARHLVTSAIPYVNGVKHLGNLVGSMLPADVYARFLRAQGHEVMFICGTDDHGTPVEIAAQKEGQPTAEFVKKWHEFQKQIYTGFALSFDWFGSSSRPQNHALTQHFARRLHASGLLEVRTEQMLYSHADNRFLPDRYVEGTCPHCSYTKARGDQCENCGRVLDPTDLINPRSAISGSTALEIRQTRHLYFKQSQLVPQLRQWVSGQKHWPLLSRSIAEKWLEEGLQDRGITRDIHWGVPVPADPFGAELAQKVFYVWFDAPIAYIAATRELADTQGQPDSFWQRWWREDQGAANVTYTQFMGKDNVYFHTMSFPATLIGSGEPWKKVDVLKSFSWLTYYGGKFSTSQGVGIFTDTALELLPADYWRYYLIARAPESDDAAFTWPDLQAVVNKDLADVLGNFINRTLTLSAKHFGQQLPTCNELTAGDHTFLHTLQTAVNKLTEHMEGVELRKAHETLRECFTLGNTYLAEQQPWQAIKTDQARAATILHLACRLIPLYARLAEPFIPHTAKTLQAIFNQPLPAWPTASTTLPALPASCAFTLPPILFPKITDEQVAEWEARFGATKA